MNLFGWAVPDAQGWIPHVEFLSKNFVGVCTDLNPERIPDFLITSLRFLRRPNRRKFVVVAAYMQEVDYVDHITRELVRQNVIAIDADRLAGVFNDLTLNAIGLMLARWQLVFHEARHFVQCEVPGIELISEDILLKIARRNSVIGKIAKKRMRAYLSHSPEARAKEADAVTIEILAVLMLHKTISDQEFDYKAVREVLLASDDVSRFLEVL